MATSSQQSNHALSSSWNRNQVPVFREPQNQKRENVLEKSEHTRTNTKGKQTVKSWWVAAVRRLMRRLNNAYWHSFPINTDKCSPVHHSAFYCLLPHIWPPPTDSKVYGRQKRGVKILCVAAELKNRGQKSICGHKKGGQYSMSHWKIGVKIPIFFSWNPWSKFYVPWKGGSKFYIFSQCLEKGGQNRGAYQPTSLKGCPPGPGLHKIEIGLGTKFQYQFSAWFSRTSHTVSHCPKCSFEFQ